MTTVKEDTSLISFKKSVSKRRVGVLFFLYREMVVFGEVCIYFHKETKVPNLWVRMPEYWENDTKFRFNTWKEKGTSEIFQQHILALLQKEHGVTLKQAIDWLGQYRDEQKKKKEKQSTSTDEKINVSK